MSGCIKKSNLANPIFILWGKSGVIKFEFKPTYLGFIVLILIYALSRSICNCKQFLLDSSQNSIFQKLYLEVVFLVVEYIIGRFVGFRNVFVKIGIGVDAVWILGFFFTETLSWFGLTLPPKFPLLLLLQNIWVFSPLVPSKREKNMLFLLR